MLSEIAPVFIMAWHSEKKKKGRMGKLREAGICTHSARSHRQERPSRSQQIQDWQAHGQTVRNDSGEGADTDKRQSRLLWSIVARGKASDPARWISLSDYCLYERAVSIALSADFLVLAHDCVQLQSIGSTCRESTGWKASGRLGDTLRRRTGKCDSIFTASVIVLRISNHIDPFTCTVACVASKSGRKYARRRYSLWTHLVYRSQSLWLPVRRLGTTCFSHKFLVLYHNMTLLPRNTKRLSKK